ncbi:MAG: hypothetical protein V3V01_17465, partial [Acidimicrobiales bacterium]
GVFHDLIDKDLLREYPQVSGVDSDGNAQLAPTAGDPVPGFPSIDFDHDVPGPLLPDTLSGRSAPVPILESTPDLSPEPTDQADDDGPIEPPQPPAEPESMDWSL